MILPRGCRVSVLRNSHASWRRMLARSTVLPTARRYQSTSSDTAGQDRKPYYITTPIYYVNAAPHIGHLYTTVLADVAKRWQELKGNEARLCTGTDEYGLKIQQAATLAGVNPKVFCDSGAETFKKLADTANISYDRFIRTTDPDHQSVVEHVWRVLHESDYITLKKHSGWYSISDEAFYPESAIQKTIHPPTGQEILVSKETGKTVEWMSEENYHFKLSSMGPRLLEFYDRNPKWLLPSQRYDMLKAEVSKGLEDLSISRPRERLEWGIPVPGDSSQTIYVWLDALINYLTFTGYPFTPSSESVWPANLQIIGKDIIRFHCIYWPAFLLAIGAELPKQILSHAHWTMSKKKMSKSDGNVVDPFHAIKRWGVDTMRFYLCLDGGIVNDGDYSNQEIEDKYNKYLGSQIGSLLTRVCSAKYSVSDAVKCEQEGRKVELSEDMAALYNKLRYEVLEGLRSRVDEKMENMDFPSAIREILEVVSETHKYIHATQLWNDDKEGVRSYMLYPAAEALRISGILLQPFMPGKMERLLGLLGVAEGDRGWGKAVLGADFRYGEGASGTKERVFPRFPIKEE
ncbi:methionyl-tRNA synthetase [Orbilia blumenaviensis]|uniref:Probable methionine--tRNA ligase, mitochondrial n=1 Tax=Orbilia blumenaviensis TaxID=1796055 RepID=A0AAV9V463_9PEZI